MVGEVLVEACDKHCREHSEQGHYSHAASGQP